MLQHDTGIRVAPGQDDAIGTTAGAARHVPQHDAAHARPRDELLQPSALGDPADKLRRGRFIDAEPATFAQSRGAQR